MACKGCGNCYFKRKQFVGSRGNPAAPIVFVGESPGVVELNKGLPMVGPSGKVLEGVLPKTLTPKDYYITNALQCFPRKGADARSNMTKMAGAISQCRERLLEEIRQHPRKVIVALGNGALWALTGNYSHKITQERGKIFASDLAEYGIVATVHPAFLLRGGGSYRKFQLDIQYALDLASGEPPKAPVIPQWNIAQTEADVKDFIDYTFDRAREIKNYTLGADIETGGFDHLRDEILLAGWSLEPDEVFIVPEHLLETDALKHRDFDKAALYGGPFQWCWHNGKFDVKFLRKYGFRSGVDHDTMLMSYAMEERRGFHDLEQVAGDELGAPDYKNMIQKYLPKKGASYRHIPFGVLAHYAALDISNTRQLVSKMYKRIVDDAKCNTLYHQVLIPASELLSHVEDNGMEVDLGKVKENENHYLAIMEQKEEIVNKHATEVLGHSINLNSPVQVSELLYDGLKLAKVKKGTGIDILEKLPFHPALEALKDYRKAAKAYSTYVKALPELISEDGRVHCTYLIHGTATGRLSSRNPNMQNQPRGTRIRGQFRAAEGYVLGEIDLDQAELRCLAALSGDPELCRIYETEGLSLHKEVSAALWGEDWKDRYAIDTPGNPVFDQAYEEYMRTKALNFGIVYGRTAPSIAQEFETSSDEAQVWIDMWANRFPVAWEFITKCRNAPARGQNLVTPFGRRKRVGVVSREQLRDLQNEAANFPHQSIASDITLMSAIKVFARLHNWGIKIVNLVHDAILIECPDTPGLFEEAVQYVMQEMVKTPVEWGIDRIPFASDAKKGIYWGDLHKVSF